MADSNPKGEQPEPQSAGVPTPTFSGEGDSSTSADADVIVSKLVTKLTPVIEETVERKFKSATDKRFSRLEKASKRIDLLAELKDQYNVPIPKDLENDMRIRDLEEQLANRPVSSSDQGRSLADTAVTEALAEFTKYGVPTNTPEAIRILGGNYRNQDHMRAEVRGFIANAMKPQPEPSPAGVVQAASVRKAEAAPIDLMSEYQKEKAQIPRGDVNKVLNLRTKYRRLAAEKGEVLEI